MAQNNNEHIPDEDRISRCCYEVAGETLDPASDFEFTIWKKTGTRCESVFWRRYAPTLAEIEERGRSREQIVNERRARKGEPPISYRGARTAFTGVIRGIQTQRGFCFHVNHFIENGDKAHSHIEVAVVPGGDVSNLKENDLRELIDALIENMPFENA